MRTAVEDLSTPHPLGKQLPGLFQEDDFAQRFTVGLDKVLAPVFLTLDGLDTYFDPRLTPPDFIEWLAGWVGLAIDQNWPIERQRSLIGRAVDLYSRRGTAQGLSDLIEIYTGVVPEITDSGGISTSEAPGGKMPGEQEPKVKVTLSVTDPSSINVARLEALVASAKPAHVLHEIELVGA